MGLLNLAPFWGWKGPPMSLLGGSWADPIRLAFLRVYCLDQFNAKCIVDLRYALWPYKWNTHQYTMKAADYWKSHPPHPEGLSMGFPTHLLDNAVDLDNTVALMAHTFQQQSARGLRGNRQVGMRLCLCMLCKPAFIPWNLLNDLNGGLRKKKPYWKRELEEIQVHDLEYPRSTLHPMA